MRTWASRMDVSVPTLMRMEKGDPAVGVGVYATALFLMGRHSALGTVAAPEMDAAALAAEIERARSGRSPRIARGTLRTSTASADVPPAAAKSKVARRKSRA